ncbi:MAG: hypothetical protein RRY35_02045, partial [Clostridiales bacterium]
MKVYRNGVEIYDLQITDKTVINQRLQVENTLTVVYESQTALDITVLDYVLVGAEKYSLSEQPQYDQTGGLYKYSYLFQGRIHQLDSLLMPDEGADDFYYFGTLYDHLDFVLAALLEKESGWSIVKPLLASVSGVPKNINYSGLSVLGAFNRICNKDEGYGLEFNITGQVATFAKSIRRETAMEFSYGQGNGLYKLSRGRLSNSKITTRAYGYGGKTNMLDGKRLALDEKFLEKNIEHYGLREQKVIIDEIFPRRNGKITSNASIVQAGKANWVVYDTTMDFDLKGQIVEG